MTTERRAVLELPDEQKFKRDLEAINRFQKIVHANMVKDQDFGVIPGTQKPTLLKPGAEKIAKLLGLADTYDILDRQENWADGFFRYLVKCSLVHLATGTVISEGLGECNSMETKYRYRWLWSSELPEGFDKDKGIKRWVSSRGGTKVPQYRVDNDEIYSQVNTVLKMAKKRALVDAALSAGRLSNVFTQDIEDMALPQDNGQPQSTEEERICPIHNVPFFKMTKGKATWYAHKIEGTNEWCNEAKPKEQAKPVETAEVEKSEVHKLDFDKDWLTESLNNLHWKDGTVKSYLKNIYQADTEGTVVEVVARLTREQREAFIKEVQDRLEML